MASDKEEYIISIRDLASNVLKTIGYNADKASGSLSRVEGSSQKAGAGIKSAGMNMMSLVKGFVAMEAAQYVWGIFKNNIAGSAIELENTKIAFEVMTGSAERAAFVLKDINQYALASNLNSPEIRQAAQTLMQYGIAGEKVIPVISMFGDITRGNVEKLNSLTLAFGQMAGAGHLMGQDLNSMIAAGFNPLMHMAEKLSKQTGETIPQSYQKMRDAMEDGFISTEMVTQAFVEATSEGGRFFGMQDRLADTTQGKWSMLTESMSLTFTKMGEGILPILGQIIDSVSYAIEWVKTNFTQISEIFAPIWDALSPLLVAFQEMGVIMGFNNDQGSIMASIFNFIGLIFKMLAPLIKVFSFLLGGALIIVTKVIKGIIELIEWIGKLFGYTGKEFKEPAKQSNSAYVKELQDRKDLLVSGKATSIPGAVTKPGKVPGMKGTGSAASHTKPIQINITMQNMVGELNVISQNLREATPQIKRVVMETLTDALNDSQRLVR